jgi:hypothetical protein
MRFQFSWSIQDGKLDFDTGRIVIFNNYILHSLGPSKDHNDLLKALAAKYHLDRDAVYAQGHRFYWKPANNGIFISPVRKIDEDWVYNNPQFFKAIIDRDFG